MNASSKLSKTENDPVWNKWSIHEENPTGRESWDYPGGPENSIFTMGSSIRKITKRIGHAHDWPYTFIFLYEVVSGGKIW